MPEWLRRVVRPREGWLSLALLLVMLLALTWSVQAAGWLEQLEFLMPVAFYAAFLGALLALLPLSVVITLPIGALVGAAIVLWTVGGEYFTKLDQLGRLMALNGDSIGFVRSLLNNAYPTELSPYAVGLAVLMWSVGFIAAYTLYRHHRVLDAILVVGAAMIVNMSGTFTQLLGYLVLFVLAALLLWLRGALLHREEGWQLRRVNENTEVPLSIMRSGIAFIAGSIALAWLLTAVAVAAPLTGAWRSLDGVWSGLQDNLDGVFGNLTNPESRFSGTTFGSKFRVSGTWVSNDADVMTVGSQHGYYLRTITYDQYTGHGWDRTQGTSRPVAAGDPIFPSATPERPTAGEAFEIETISIQVQGQIGRNIFTPGFPTAALVPVNVYQSGGEPFLGGLEATNAIAEGDGYQVTAAISNATEAELAAAGTDYPDSIKEFYLGTDGVTERTRALAQQIVSGQKDPYHMADALADYLRTSPDFHYETSVDAPDPNRDLVDQFLFDPDGRRGYCEYFASAMAVMARSVGLPSRVAVGFAPGQRLAQGIYQYREKNAHAWAEVYFPGYGWQIFEATHSISPPLRERGTPSTVNENPGAEGPSRGGNQGLIESEPGVISALPSFHAAPGAVDPGTKEPPASAQREGNGMVILLIVLLGLGVLGWQLLRTRRRWRFMAPGDRQWHRLTLAASRAGVGQQASETIYEYAGWLEDQIPQRRPEIKTIADAKVWQAYSGRSMGETMIERIERAWTRLRLPLMWLAARRRIRRFLHPRHAARDS
ncbi:MAG TPA: transglutaminaseTgpA domain-containing protein [Candidatus Limnocylindria bacterium]